MAARTAIVEGDRNVLVNAPTNNTLIVTGDRNTVEMKLDGAGAALAFAFRWNRPRPRKRGDRPAPPPRYEQHVDRDDEVAALTARDDPPRVANLYGDAGVGKTHVLVEALARRESKMPDGTVYLDGRERDAEDLLHAIFDSLFECRIPLRDLHIERHLGDRRALVALEDVELESDRAQRLALAIPQCRLVVTSRTRALYDGLALRIGGLAPEHAVAIAEQEFGRSLSGRERAAVQTVAAALDGHPLALRQAFGRARDGGLQPDQLAPRAAGAYDRAQALSDREREIARVLAVHGDAPVGLEHIEALSGGPDGGAAQAAAALAARSEARSYSPRYSLAPGLGDGFDERELEPELDRALEHFTAWARDEARAGRRDRVLLEMAALLALLERASAAGRAPQVVRLGLAIEGALAWGNRWAAWQRVLELVLAAARASGDGWAEGAALHQLGTRAYGSGDAAGAARTLEQALALRDEIGDRAGAETTRRNLRVVRGPVPLPYRLSHLPIAIVAAVVLVLAVGGGVAGAGLLGDGDGSDGGDGGPATARLSLSVQGPGSVSGRPGTLECSDACEAPFGVGGHVTLTATPRGTASFAGWSGACSGTRPRCELEIDGPSSVRARFRERTTTTGGDDVTLTVRPAGDGTGTVTGPAGSGIDCPAVACSATFAKGAPAALLTATAATGSTFAGWGGACAGTAPACAVSLAASRTVRPRFDLAAKETAPLTVAIKLGERGTITSDPAGVSCRSTCTVQLTRGEQVTLHAAPDDGFYFNGWSDPACRPSGTGDCVVTIGEVQRVTAAFARTAETPPTTTTPVPTTTVPIG